MASQTSITLRKKANNKGEYPLAIRITKNRKSSYMYVGHYIDLKHWDDGKNKVRKSHPNAQQLNNLLISKQLEAEKILINLQSNNEDFSCDQIKQKLNPTANSIGFFTLAEAYLQELTEQQKLSRLSSDKARINHIRSFTNSKQLTFQEIDEAFLKRFRLYLKKERGVSERSIINNLIVIRTLYNRAIELGIVERKRYPFGKNKIKIQFPETNKVGLTIEELQKLSAVSNLSQEEIHARNVWFFSFYFAGIRAADVLKIRWSDIYDDRLHYRMNKNAKLVSLKVPSKVYPILNQYEIRAQENDSLIFPYLQLVDFSNAKELYLRTKAMTKRLNKHLKHIADKAGIHKRLTMHIARHTFGNLAGDAIPIQMLQKLYRHSSITTTMQYQSNFITNETDKALEKVIGF